MTDYAVVAERLVNAYNAKDFDALEAMIDPHLDFAHFNRDFAFSERAALMGVLRHFAAEFIPDRRFLPPERVTVCGPLVIREGYYTGTARVDVPGFAPAGGKVMLKFCSVFRFDMNGMLVEWKDYG